VVGETTCLGISDALLMPAAIYNRFMLRYIVLLLCCAPVVLAQTQEVEKLLQDSEAAWNRGDLPSFASHYEDSAETTFIGREVVHGGVDAILARYRRAYPTRETMGKLTFSEIEVRPLADGIALANGKFTLQRTAAGGGDASGRFTLILKRTPVGWKIIHDHTS
jgi:uncharacterized protein (TIGR02246 family)